MRILVTGGAGFIGSNFLNRFVPRYPEHEFLNVDALTYAANLGNLASLEGASNYAFSRTDLREKDAVVAVVDTFRPNAVVHLAAESHVDRSIRNADAFVATNVLGTFHLLEACRDLQERQSVVFHHVSTDEVYGSLGATGRFSETSRYDPSSPYSASKAASDHFVRAYHRTYGLPVKITNCSNNFGPYQFPEKLIPLVIHHALTGRPLPVYGQGLNVRDWLFVEDHCDALWTVLEHGRVGETYNVGGNGELRNIDLVRILCSIIAHECQLDREELLGRIELVPDRPGHDIRYAIDAAKLRTDCGWEPSHSLEDGLVKTVRWYRDNRAWLESVASGEYKRWLEEHYGGGGSA